MAKNKEGNNTREWDGERETEREIEIEKESARERENDFNLDNATSNRNELFLISLSSFLAFVSRADNCQAEWNGTEPEARNLS